MKKQRKSKHLFKSKIDKNLLQQALAAGKIPKEIAQEMGVTRQAVSQAIKRLPPETAGHVVRNEQKIEQIVDNTIDVLSQFKTINNSAFDVLNDVKVKKGVYSQRMVLDCCRAIKEQLEFYTKMLSILHDHETIQRFQEEVLEAIGEVAPDVREKIINRLKERQSARWSLELPGR
jgi:predicted DNA-binding protein YlxM (UPF0122 family)